MSDVLIEIFGVGAVVAILASLIESSASRRFRPTTRGWILAVIGLVLVTIGALMPSPSSSSYVVGTAFPGASPVLVFVRTMVCLLGGALFLAIGLLRRLAASPVGGPRQIHDPMAKAGLELRAAQELLNSVIHSSINGVMILKAMRDEAGIIVDFECRLMNKEAEQLLGRSAAVLVGDPLLKHLSCIKTSGLFQEALSIIQSGLPFRDERRCTDGGAIRWYQIAGVRHGDSIVVNFADVSGRRRSEEQLRHAAQHDTLTALANRALFGEQLMHAISRAKRWHNYKYAVLFLDCDRFKIINDSLGHEVGDQLLVSMADRLRATVRSLETSSRARAEHLAARLGGDEFAVLLNDIDGVREAIAVAERLQRELSAPYVLAGHEVISTASIGIVTSDGNYKRPDDLMRDADTAMYQAKNSGKARYVVFDERMHSEVVQRLNLEKDLRVAVAKGQFELVYQPIICLETAALAGFEALIRWVHPKQGIVRPAMFITLAEELGLIIPIGSWVLRQACRQLRRWQKRFPEHPPLSMGVNLSKQQVTDKNLIPTIAHVIEETGISPASLRLEITESTIVDDLEGIMPDLDRLKDLGVQIAMDDFGTGHSSLGFLHRVPMDVLKIDRSFIDRTGKTRDYAAIIHTVIQLAHNLGMDVVAEGIETHDQMILLQSLDCNFGQGYLFGQPLTAQAAESLLKTGYRFSVAATPPLAPTSTHVA